MLFWTDWENTKARIERAFTDGSDRKQLLATGLRYPNGLAIDYSAGRLYWCDAGTDKIGSMYFDGTSLQTVYRKLAHPFGLAIYDGMLYWSDWKVKAIFQAPKTPGRKKQLRSGLKHLFGVQVFAKRSRQGKERNVLL